ncbi:MAG: MFS transporter [Rickettsiaceae bacterium]|nr:MFS transporter [Rickettsiaceae bacterium]
MDKLNLNILKYSSLALVLSFVGLPVYIHTPHFYSTYYDISLAKIGTILLFLRVIDAALDPIIGALSDKYSDYRKKIIFFAIILLVISVFALFSQPLFSPLIWFAIFIFLATTAYSIITINYYALGALFTDNKLIRTNLTTRREAIGLLGLIAASAAPTILQKYFAINIAFQYYTWIFVFVTLISSTIFYSWYNSYQEKAADIIDKKKVRLYDIVTALISKPIFYLIVFISSFASAIPSILVLFFIEDILALENMSGLFLVLYFLSGALGMPIWQILAKKMGKLTAWNLAMIIAIITFCWAFFLQKGAAIEYGIICCLSGIALGGELALPPSILADLSDQNKKITTTNFAILAFLMKFALAIASGSILYLLSLSAFKPGGENNYSSLYWLSFYYALLPCIIKIIAVLLSIFLAQKINSK